MGALDVLDGKVSVRGHTRGKPTKDERRMAIAETPFIFAGPTGPTMLDRGTVARALPVAAGTIAGLLTKPFAGGVPAAAGAGSLGELGGELLMGETPNLGKIARAGATQGAYEAAGRGIGKGLKLISGPIMQLAVRAGPEVAQTALREGITNTKLGIQKMLTKMGAYGRETNRIVAQAVRYGKPYDMAAMLKAAYADAAPGVSMTGDETRALNESLRKFVGQNPSAMSNAKTLHELKQAADVAAREIHNLPIGQRPSPAQQAAAGFYKSFADRARMALNETVPGYRESNVPTEALAKLRDAIAPIAKKEMSKGAQVASAMLRPGVRAAIGAQVGYDLPGDRTRNALMGATLGAVGASPQGLSSLAMGLNSPLLQMLLRQAPRAVGTATQ
jgi:hypothetical protein